MSLAWISAESTTVGPLDDGNIVGEVTSHYGGTLSFNLQSIHQCYSHPDAADM